MRIHLFLDKSVMELFVDHGRQCVTRVVYPEADDVGVAAFAEGGSAELVTLQAWPLRSIWDR